MTRKFWKRSAASIMPLIFGLAIVWGDPSLYRNFVNGYSVFEVALVLSALVAFFAGVALWVCVEFWNSRPRRSGKTAAVIAIIAGACVCSQRAEAWVMLPTNAPTAKAASVELDQTFFLSADQQRQVDAAVEQVSREAKEHPGFVMTVELAIGIFIAAVLIGTVVRIIVRLVVQSLDRMMNGILNREMNKQITNRYGTNMPPQLIGAGWFLQRPATTNDLQSGAELNVSFAAPKSGEAAALVGAVTGGETDSLDDFLAGFGLPNNWPAESVTGQGVVRIEDGYAVAPSGHTNFVTLGFESTTNLMQGSWTHVLNLRVPVGAMIDFADLTGNSEGRYWRVQTITP